MNQESFRGNELKLQREEMGLSREDVFRKLRIPLDVITRMETGQLDSSPSLTYCIGFVKTYCTLLNISPEPYIADLVESQREPKGILNQAILGEVKDRPIWMHEALMWATIIAIIVLGWVTYSVVFQPDSADIESQIQADSVDIRVPQFPMR